MNGLTQPVHDFLVQLEKSLTIRRLYAPHMAFYREVVPRLEEKFRQAAREGGFSLRVGPRDLFLGEDSVLHRPKPDESFFFPLYRDGLRELSFSSGTSARELGDLLSVFEAERSGEVGPDEDTVVVLWQADLEGITFRAVDGIGDVEGGDQDPGGKARDEYGALVAELMEKIRDPAPPVTGASYAYVLDADVRVSERDFRYDPTTTRRTFEENPKVLRLTSGEADSLRAEVSDEEEGQLLERFVEILLAMLDDPASTVPPEGLMPVFGQLVQGLWQIGEYRDLSYLLGRLEDAAELAPSPEARAEMRELLGGFFIEERLEKVFQLLAEEKVSLQAATGLWELAGDRIWDRLVDFWQSLPEGRLSTEVKGFLRRRLTLNPQLLRQTLTTSYPHRARAALSLLDSQIERLYVREILALTSHPDEEIRLQSLAASARIGGSEAREVLLRAVESDPAAAVRMLALRLAAAADPAGLAARLRPLVRAPSFASRPHEEQRQLMVALARADGESARELFESWLPRKRWFWTAAEREAAELALEGLAACGGRGQTRVRELAAAGGRLGRAARSALESAAGAPGGEG